MARIYWQGWEPYENGFGRVWLPSNPFVLCGEGFQTLCEPHTVRDKARDSGITGNFFPAIGLFPGLYYLNFRFHGPINYDKFRKQPLVI